jgi:nicotinate-nucleotide pyrophosphorylase (carboxylating)
MFTAAESGECRRLVQWALEEDLGSAGDLTSQAVIPAELYGQAVFVARKQGVLAGLPAAAMVFATLDPALVFQPVLADGAPLRPASRIARVSGSLRSILGGERTALNFLQRLSGIATLTRRYVDAVAGLPCAIFDTRKTTPGWRLLEKYAVRQGGGHNHRLGLYDGILIKDNHLAAFGKEPSAIATAVNDARRPVGASVPVEIEVDNLQQLEEALACRPDMVLLDNMSLEDMRAAVGRRNLETSGKILLEASGCVSLDTVRAIAETGVDRISVGALTHSAPALDIALDHMA